MQSLEVADNTYRDGSSALNNTEASFIEDGGVSVDQRKMNAGGYGSSLKGLGF